MNNENSKAKTANDYKYVSDATGVYVPEGVDASRLGRKQLGSYNKHDGNTVYYYYRLPLGENGTSMSGSNAPGGSEWEPAEFGY